MQNNSLFITIEGIEGAGKSTGAKWVINYLDNLNLPKVHTREPGGTLVAEKIRDILLQQDTKIKEPITDEAELLLLFAARSQHLNNLIIPALNNGKIVVCERFTDATFAYQGAGRGINIEYIKYLANLVQHTLQPDLVLLFDIEPQVGLTRALKRGVLDRIEQEKIDFFTRVRNMYLQLANNNSKYKIINAHNSLTIVKKQVIEILELYFNANKLFK